MLSLKGELCARAAERTVQVDADSPPGDVEIRLEATEGVTVEALLATGRPPGRLRAAALDGNGAVVASGTYLSGENGRTAAVPPAGVAQVVLK